MVVGRSVNGWSKDAAISPQDASDAAARAKFAESVFHSVTDVAGFPGCPMKWVADSWHLPHGNGGYCTNRSAFWRVTRKLVGTLNVCDPEDVDWSSNLAWSNLYKLSPIKGWNPSGRVAQAQFDGCLELLKSELEILAPHRLTLATGWNWARPFLDGLSYREVICGSGYVESVGYIGSASVVVACHPMTKKETKWVSEVGDAFRKIAN